MSVNRNKESVTLDFKSPRGREILDRLVADADVLVENFRPGTLRRIGLDYASLQDVHPRLVYCSISGFGQHGPRASQPGYDAVVQAEGGLMSITGDAGGPPFRLGVAIADLTAGLLAAHGIALALFARERSGRGQYVDVALFDAVISLLSYQASAALNAIDPASRAWVTGTRRLHRTTSSLRPTAISSSPSGMTSSSRDSAQAAGLEALAARRPLRDQSRSRGHELPELRDRLVAALRERTRAEWIDVADHRRSAVRCSARRAGRAGRSAGRGARHDCRGRTCRRRHGKGARCPGEVVRYSRVGPRGTAGAGSTHRRRSSPSSGMTPHDIAALRNMRTSSERITWKFRRFEND